jgi:hypothetical protein
MKRDRPERGVQPCAAWLLMAIMAAPACQEPNPDFDGPAATSNATETTSTSTGPAPDTDQDTGPVTSDGSSTGPAPGSSSGEPPGTSSGEPGGSTTEGCMGTECAGICVDTMTDDDNCGMCNNKCPGQQECMAGECVMP